MQSIDDIHGFAVMKSNSLNPNEITTISFLSEGEDSHEVLPSECSKKRGGRFFLKTKNGRQNCLPF